MILNSLTFPCFPESINPECYRNENTDISYLTFSLFVTIGGISIPLSADVVACTAAVVVVCCGNTSVDVNFALSQ
jgi:hypothetical protein